MREGMGKYRGKDLETGEWRFGFYMVVAPPKIAVGERGKYKHMIVFEGFADWGMNCNFQSEVDPATVGQFTGITDREGVDVFEDDRWDWDNGGELGVISFNNGCFWCDEERGFLLESMAYDIKITGTIHDNPELIKEQ